MRYSHKHKFILINNWKCGSSSICSMFSEYCEPRGEVDWSSRFLRPVGADFRHAPAKEIKKVFSEKGWDFDKYIKITSVRNPWARIVSLYHYRIEKLKRIKSKSRTPSFWKYVEDVVPKWQAGIVNRWNTREMIQDYNGENLVDYVVRLESLKEDLSPIVEKHFPNFDINYNTRECTSQHDHYSTYYNERTKFIIADLFFYDIKRWGYKFEEEQK